MNFWTVVWILGIIVGISEYHFGMIALYLFFLIINIGNIQNKKKGLSPVFSLKKKKAKKVQTSSPNTASLKAELKRELKNEIYMDLYKELREEIEMEVRKKAEISKLVTILSAGASSAIKPTKIFTLDISAADTEEIRKEVGIAPRDESLEWGRMLWDSFYKDAYNKMIKTSETKKLTGIYKITNTKNGKIYIGQAVNIGERWRQHIKAGMGAEFPSGNQMYKDMLKQGPETFTFEIQEKCEKSQLNAREMYWISFYNAYENGYNQTKGNKDK
jgi:hypothetical protein